MWRNVVAILAIVLGISSPTSAGTAISHDLTFGETLTGTTELHTPQPAGVFSIALKNGGVYTGCGQMGPAMIIGQMTNGGNLDVTNFNAPNGFTVLPFAGTDSAGAVSCVTQEGDQKTIVGGYYLVGSGASMVIARLNNDGSVDTTGFGFPNGYITLDFASMDGSPDHSILVQNRIQSADGFIVAVGAYVVSTSPYMTQMVSFLPCRSHKTHLMRFPAPRPWLVWTQPVHWIRALEQVACRP